MANKGDNRRIEPFGRFPIVCIGISAGGISPLKQLFRNINSTTGMAFVVINHIRKVPTLLPEIVSKCTTMAVQIAAPGLRIQPNHVYILPSGQEITTADGCFSVRSRSKLKGWTNVFTVFLESLEKSRHPGIAVVLSGLDADGATALRAFNDKGGVIIAQAPESSDVLPQLEMEKSVLPLI